MGNRATVRFKVNDELTPCVYTHWDGEDLHTWGLMYAREYKVWRAQNKSRKDPYTRPDADVVLFDFVRWIYENELMSVRSSTLRLLNTEEEWDAGHMTINLLTLEAEE